MDLATLTTTVTKLSRRFKFGANRRWFHREDDLGADIILMRPKDGFSSSYCGRRESDLRQKKITGLEVKWWKRLSVLLPIFRTGNSAILSGMKRLGRHTANANDDGAAPSCTDCPCTLFKDFFKGSARQRLEMTSYQGARLSPSGPAEVMYPSVIVFIAKGIPVQEQGLLLSLIMAGCSGGSVVTTALWCDSVLGWPASFHVLGEYRDVLNEVRIRNFGWDFQ